MPHCQFCEQDVESDEALVEHKKMRINLKCKRCDRPFVNYCALDGHLAHAHTALPIRAPNNGKANTVVEAGGTEKHTRLAISSQQGIEKSNNETRSTSAATGAKDRSETTSAPGKETAIISDELSVQAEVRQPEKRDEVMMGNAGLSSLDIGIANPMACPTCNKAEGSLMTLRVHQVVQEHCYCKECKAFFLSDGAQKVHTDIVHRFTCKECSKVFATFERLQGHQVQHGHCYCKSCNSFFANCGDKIRHSATVHVHPCGICKSLFRYPGELIEHQNSLRHHARCTHCTAKFGWAHELIKHVEQDHTPCKCASCQYGYETAEELHQHQKVAINFYCMVCNISFQSDKATELHNDVLHQSVTCMKCGRHFLSDQALLVHTTSMLNCLG